MGLMMDGERPVILSVIADAEDFCGDMDFKGYWNDRMALLHFRWI